MSFELGLMVLVLEQWKLWNTSLHAVLNLNKGTNPVQLSQNYQIDTDMIV